MGESIWLRLPPDLHRALREVAEARHVSIHEAARIILGIGVEVMRGTRREQR